MTPLAEGPISSRTFWPPAGDQVKRRQVLGSNADAGSKIVVRISHFAMLAVDWHSRCRVCTCGTLRTPYSSTNSNSDAEGAWDVPERQSAVLDDLALSRSTWLIVTAPLALFEPLYIDYLILVLSIDWCTFRGLGRFFDYFSDF